jgi:hypothetical protein
MKYYSVKVKVRTETENKIKEHSELGIVSAETPEDAAYKVREYYGALPDFEVSEVKETKIIYIID